MTRIFALLVTVIAAAMVALAVSQSPPNESEEPDSFDIEPPILKGNLSGEPLPGTTAPDSDIVRMEKKLGREKVPGWSPPKCQKRIGSSKNRAGAINRRRANRRRKTRASRARFRRSK